MSDRTTITPTREQVAALEATGLVTVRSHKVLPLVIVNYTPRAQYERAWTPELLQCRGLVYDAEWNLVARPLPKFFNYEEHLGENPVAGPLPTGPYTVQDKYDGSLGIVFRWKEHLLISTRGSFHSEQADRGQRILQSHMARDGWRLDAGVTHLFEILYPENRIVVDYGQQERLQWLTSIETATGKELPHLGLSLGWNNPYPPFSIEELKRHERPNAEGYVLRYANGQRVKIKFARYVELHRLVTGLSTTSIWEVLRRGEDPLEALTNLPDELYGWAEAEAKKLIARHGELAYATLSECDFIKQHMPLGSTRKDFAARAKVNAHPALLFLAYDGKHEQLKEAVWKMIEPVRETPVTTEEC